MDRKRIIADNDAFDGGQDIFVEVG
jgi:hypothetical protein